jgi:cold shock protein
MVGQSAPVRPLIHSGLIHSRAFDPFTWRHRRPVRPIFSEIVMSAGTVKWFNPTKGYGFIQPQGGGQDVFVHISAVERAGLNTLNEGQHVEYEIVSNRGKSSAENLKVR